MKVGFVGLGNMGFGMVKNLLKHKYDVVVYDIDPEKILALVEEGAEKAENIKEITKEVDIVILCLPHPDVSRNVINDLVNTNKIKTIIETSTLTPKDSIDFQSIAQKQSVNYLCAPMLAGKQMALEGNVHFIVEGDQEVFNKYRSLLNSMGRATFMGNVPNATLAKLGYNICRYSNVATALTVISFLKQYSNNLKPIYEVLKEGSLENSGKVWQEEMKDVALDNKPYKFAGSKIPLKDLDLVIQLIKEKNLPSELFEVIKNIYLSQN